MKTLINRFAQDQSGATAIEYGLIAALVGVAIIAGAGALGTSLDDTFTALGDALPDVPAAGGGGGAAPAGP